MKLRKEAADWEVARSAGTIPALADFTRRYPNSARAGAARAKLFMRQFTRGSLMFGSAVLLILAMLVPLFAYFAHLVAQLMPQFLADPSMAQNPDAAMSVGLRLLAGMGVLVIGPWIVFGVLLWIALTRLRARPIWRTTLTFLIALVPMLIWFVHIGVDSGLRQSGRPGGELAQSAIKVLQVQEQIKTHKKDAGATPDQAAAERIRQLEQELATVLHQHQASSWRWSFKERHLPFLAAGIAAVTTFLTLLLSAGAISGWHQLRLWGASIRGGALVAALGVLGWSLYSHSVWNDSTIGALFAIWLSICGFLALGLVRAAEHDAPLPALGAASTPA